MRWARQQLDDFNPDLVIVFGDDQYENFREDGVPAFQINCFESFEAKPWEHARPSPNAWNEASDTVFRYQANRRAAKHLVTRLIEEGFEVAYAYEPRHEAMPHAILNTLLFLDWDRRGFDYPIVPFLTNCYGRHLSPLRGRGVNNLAEIPQEEDLDPPGPTPWRCFDLGRALAHPDAEPLARRPRGLGELVPLLPQRRYQLLPSPRRSRPPLLRRHGRRGLRVLAQDHARTSKSTATRKRSTGSSCWAPWPNWAAASRRRRVGSSPGSRTPTRSSPSSVPSAARARLLRRANYPRQFGGGLRRANWPCAAPASLAGASMWSHWRFPSIRRTQHPCSTHSNHSS